MLTMGTTDTNLESRKRNCKWFCAFSYILTVLGNSVYHWLECFTGLIELGCLPNWRHVTGLMFPDS